MRRKYVSKFVRIKFIETIRYGTSARVIDIDRVKVRFTRYTIYIYIYIHTFVGIGKKNEASKRLRPVALTRCPAF